MIQLHNRYWWEKYAQHRLNQLTAGRLVGLPGTPIGSRLADIARQLPSPSVILDVGANTGQSTIRFRVAFPKARIISLEPVASTFRTPAPHEGPSISSVTVQRWVAEGHGTMYLTPVSVKNSLVQPSDGKVVGTEDVSIETLDAFVARQGIDEIDLLKVDAEGFDLKVIAGAASTLAAGRVRFALIEVGFHPDDDRHLLFDDVRAALLDIVARHL